MKFHTDCRHFLGDRPCAPHKREGARCPTCTHYESVRFRILIIKLDALGDVLRTTCILDALHREHPGVRIEWLTGPAAAPLFRGNPLVHRVHTLSDHSHVMLQIEHYDLVINLDNALLSSQLATLAHGTRKVGYGYDGRIYPFNDEALEWYEMGLLDDRKKANRKTYDQIAHEICKLPHDESSPHLYLSEIERVWARERAKSWGIVAGEIVVGLNTGASDRWPCKKWTEAGFADLIDALLSSRSSDSPALQVLLLGGPGEVERNARLAKRFGDRVFDTGGRHQLRQFLALVDLCDLMVTGDTLALHVAIALKKHVVALFGPTSVAEIDLHGRGTKIVSDAPCAGSYRTDCDAQPTCMDRITARQVLDAVYACIDDRTSAVEPLVCAES